MIALRKMTEAEYFVFLMESISQYTAEKMKGEGLSAEDAANVANNSFRELLPDGLQTRDHHLFSIVENASQENVGAMWFARRQTESKIYAYIYDFFLHENARGKGWGKLAMRLLEDEVRKVGLNSIQLHVFGHNKIARSLYEAQGFRTTNVIMAKEL